METEEEMSWHQESARHSLARKGIKTGQKKEIKSRKKIPTLTANLKKIYPAAYTFMAGKYNNEESKEILDKTKIIILPNYVSPKDFGESETIDATAVKLY